MADDTLRGPYNLKVVENCFGCVTREEGLFCQLPHSALSELNNLRQTAFYPKGALLFVEGQPTRGLFLMCAGQAKLYVNSAEGQSLTLRIVEPGEALCLSALIADESYPATAETLCPSQVSFLPRLGFLQMMRAHPDVSLRVAKHLSMEVSKAWQQTRMLALAPDTHAKLTQFLFGWAEKHGQATADGLRITLHMTHEEIARNIGASRESVSRILSDWKQRGVIRVCAGSITIPNPKEFREAMAPVRSR
ncbi:MAG TPA: Crp/Fnr family transcriptional regulator [Terriglobia bacterium]|nr:Crp/Fnr family transcriptional regulator [Terriglobia bacterium]